MQFIMKFGIPPSDSNWNDFKSYIKNYGAPIQDGKFDDTDFTYALDFDGTKICEKKIRHRINRIYKQFTTDDSSRADNSGDDWEPADQKNKKLNIVIQKEINTYTHHSLYLCFILADDQFNNWFLERFIQLYTYIHPEMPCLWIDYLAEPYNQVVARVKYRYENFLESKDIIEFVIKQINQGNYIYIYIDEFFFNGKKAFIEKRHIVHDTLFYGYDNKKRIINAIGFNTEDEFVTMEFDYQSVRIAFRIAELFYPKIAPWVEEQGAVSVVKPRCDNRYSNFNLKLFIKKMEEYIYSIDDDSYPHYLHADSEHVKKAGICVLDVIIRNLQGEFADFREFDYRAFHLIHEHKKLLYKKMIAVAEKYAIQKKLESLLNEYKQIVVRTDTIRLKYLQTALVENDFKTISFPIKNIKSKKQLAGLLADVKNAEQKVLKKIYARFIEIPEEINV